MSFGLKKRSLIAATLLFSSLSAVAAPQILDPWIAEVPPGAPVAGGFMELKNPDDKNVSLTAVTTPNAKAVELHQTVIKGTMARMVLQDAIEIPANGSTQLAPGGYHLMMFGPKDIVLGEQVPLTLHFSDGSKQDVKAQVRKRSGTGHHHHHH